MDQPTSSSEPLRDDGYLVLSRRGNGGGSHLSLSVAPSHRARGVVERLRHEYALRQELSSAWAVRPNELSEQDGGPAVMLLKDPGGQLVSSLVGQPLDILALLRIAIGVAASVGRAHERGPQADTRPPASVSVAGERARASERHRAVDDPMRHRRAHRRRELAVRGASGGEPACVAAYGLRSREDDHRGYAARGRRGGT